MYNYSFYVCDTETTGLDPYMHDVIELSLLRMSDGVQKTWCLKPINIKNVDAAALRINQHKIEDLNHTTPYGRETYKDPEKVIVEIENWVMNDGVSTDYRALIGQNILFDKNMLEHLWKKCNAYDSFPFGRRFLDTMIIEFFLDLAKDSISDSYSLSSIAKKYGIKNEKSHTAAADVRCTKEVFDKQLEFFRKTLIKTT
jgi:DNA polymerase III epsilon subunit-like protein